MVASLEYEVVPEVASIVAVLSSGQLFSSPNLASLSNVVDDEVGDDDENSNRNKLYELFRIKHKKFRDERSDHLTILNIYGEWIKRRGTDLKFMKRDELYDWCWDNFLSMRCLVTSEKVQRQLIDVMPDVEDILIKSLSEESGLKKSRVISQLKKSDRILIAFCQGLFINAAKIHITRSLSRGDVVRGWTSVKEGIVVR